MSDGDFSGTFDVVSILGDLKLHALYMNGEIQSTALYDVTVDEETNIAERLPQEHRALFKQLNKWIRSLVTSATEEVGCLSDPGNFDSE